MNQTVIPRPLSFEPPKWFTETYDGMETDIADDILSAVYWRKRKQLEIKGKVEPENDTVVAAQMIADALMGTASQLDGVVDASKRAFMRIVYSTQTNGYYRMSKDEYDSPKEWLIDKIPSLKETDQLYDILYLVEHFFPMLDKIGNGWEPEELLKFSEHWSKTKAAIPFLRTLTNSVQSAGQPYEDRIIEKVEELKKVELERELAIDTAEEPKLRKKVEKLSDEVEELRIECDKIIEEAGKDFNSGIAKVLDVIQDPRISAFAGPNNVKNALFNPDKKFTIFKGSKATLPGKSIYFIILDSEFERAMESATKNFVEWDDTDAITMKKDISSLSKKE